MSEAKADSEVKPNIEAKPTTAAEAAAVVVNMMEGRSLLLRSRPRPVKFIEFEGRKWAVVTPTSGERSAILNGAAKVSIGADGKPGVHHTDLALMQALAIRYMVHTAIETGAVDANGQPVLAPGVQMLSDEHVPELMSNAAGSILETFGDACVGWMNEQVKEAKVAAKK